MEEGEGYGKGQAMMKEDAKFMPCEREDQYCGRDASIRLCGSLLPEHSQAHDSP